MRIAQILYAGSWGEVSPETIEQGLGGRETAMIKLAEAWAKAGHEVTNFVNVEKGRRFVPDTITEEITVDLIQNGFHGFHEYLPIGLCRPMLSNMPWDAAVTWEMPSIFQEQDVRDNCAVTVCEMQVAHFPGKEMEMAEEYCDYVAALSPWHAEFLKHSGLEMKNGTVVSLPNGVDMSRYPQNLYDKKQETYSHKTDPKFVYSSSPDRGLWHLLKAWPLIRKSFPGAKLFVCYGLKQFIEQMKWTHVRQAEMCLEIEELIQQDGVTNMEKIGQRQLAELQMQADAWLYPLDPLWPTETGCITAVENAAAGNPLIFSDADCLKSEFGSFSSVIDLPFDASKFVNAIEVVLGNKSIYKEMQRHGREFAETRTWDKIGEQWLDMFAKTVRS